MSPSPNTTSPSPPPAASPAARGHAAAAKVSPAKPSTNAPRTHPRDSSRGDGDTDSSRSRPQQQHGQASNDDADGVDHDRRLEKEVHGHVERLAASVARASPPTAGASHAQKSRKRAAASADVRPADRRQRRTIAVSDDDGGGDGGRNAVDGSRMRHGTSSTSITPVRKSQRQVIKPLEYWKGERVEYQMKRSDAGVVVPTVKKVIKEDPASAVVSPGSGPRHRPAKRVTTNSRSPRNGGNGGSSARPPRKARARSNSDYDDNDDLASRSTASGNDDDDEEGEEVEGDMADDSDDCDDAKPETGRRRRASAKPRRRSNSGGAANGGRKAHRAGRDATAPTEDVKAWHAADLVWHRADMIEKLRKVAKASAQPFQSVQAVRFGAFCGVGFLRLPVGAEKPARNTHSTAMLFHVMDGSITATLGDEDFDLDAGCTFAVPRGGRYALRNEGDENTTILFMQAQET